MKVIIQEVITQVDVQYIKSHEIEIADFVVQTDLIPKTLLDAKGDTIAASADNTPARVAAGVNNQVMTADSAQGAGVKWGDHDKASHDALDIDADTVDGEHAADLKGAMVLVERVVLAAPAASFDFTGIPATFRDLQITGILRISRVNATDGCRFKINNDGGATYDTFHTLNSHSSIEATQESYGATSILVGDLLNAANAPADTFSRLEIYIPSYVNTVTEKTGYLTANCKYQESAAGLQYMRTEFHWRSTAAISRITVYPVTGPNFVAGSELSLYGLG